jgi:uncharacterized protein YgfB (UPF0149 family)
MFSDDEEVTSKSQLTTSMSTPLDFVSTINSGRKKTTGGGEKINKHFKMKLVKEVHISKNLPEVADQYGVSADSLRSWYQRYCSGKPLSDSKSRKPATSNVMEEAFADLEEENEEDT